MSWRIWLFRLSVCSLVIAAGVVGWLVYLQTNSAAVRAKVIEQIQADFPGIEVKIGSAWIRPLGGLWLRDVRLQRREDPGHPFLIVPSATISHDKEQLARGKLVIRKVELSQPVFRLRRDAEGNLNLPTLPQRGGRDSILPLLVVRQGTVIYEDRSGGQVRPPLELRDMNLTVVNDPAPRIAFHGNGTTLLGAVKWTGTLQRNDNQLSLGVEVPAYAVTPPIMEQLGAHFPDVRHHLADLAGQGDARLDLRYQLDGKSGWHPDLRVNLRRGRFGHPRLPLSPLLDVEVSARLRDGVLTIENGRARSGQTRVTMDLEAALALDAPPSDDPEKLLNRFNLAIENLTLSGDLFNQLPPNLRQIYKDFKPQGPIGLTFKLERRDRWWSQRCIVHPDGIEAEFVDFPYRLASIHGKLEQVTTSDGKDELTVSLTGASGGRPIVIEGTIRGSGAQTHMNLKIHGRGLTLDDNLRHALGNNRNVLDSFRPIGTGDFVARLKQEPGDLHTDIHMQIDFIRLAVCHEEFPYPLENIRGTLQMRFGKETRVNFEQFVGTHNGGEVALDGNYLVTPSGNVLRAKLRASALPFDADLNGAFARVNLQSLWKAARPSGRLSFTGDVDHTNLNAPQGAAKPPSRLVVNCHQFTADSVLPEFLPYELTGVTGAFHYANDRVTLTSFSAHHRTSRLSLGAPGLPCAFVMKPGGGMWAELKQVRLVPLVADEELLCALPTQLRSGLSALDASGPMTFTAEEFVVDTASDPRDKSSGGVIPAGARMSAASLRDEEPSPWMYWKSVNVRMSGASVKLGMKCENVHGLVSLTGEYRDGRIGAVSGNVVVDQATVRRQPLQAIHAQLVIDPAKAPGVLQIKNVKAKLFGGALAGEVALMLEPVVRYDVRLNVLGLKLEEVARHNKLESGAEVSGRAEARLYLAGQGADLKNLRGGGVIHVPKGRIYNLPPLLDVLKFVKLHAPDGTAFEEAFAKFRVEGEVVHFEQLDLLGKLISLTGDGEMKLDGTGLKLDIYPIWLGLVRALPPHAREIPNAISRSLYKVEMSGSLLGQLDYRSEAIPVIVEPVRRLLDRMGN